VVTVVVTKRKNERATARLNERRRRSRSQTVKLRKSSLMSACGECGIVLVLGRFGRPTVERKFEVRKSCIIISERPFPSAFPSQIEVGSLSSVSAQPQTTALPCHSRFLCSSGRLSICLLPACFVPCLLPACVCRLRQMFARCLLCAFYCATWSSCGGMSRNVNCTCKRTQIEAV